MYIRIIIHIISIYVLIRQFSALRAGLTGQGWGSVAPLHMHTKTLVIVIKQHHKSFIVHNTVLNCYGIITPAGFNGLVH